MRRFSTCIALVALVGCGSPPAEPESAAIQEAQSESASQGSQGVWSQKAQLADIRSEAANAFADGKLYVMGGLARGLESSTLTQEYDPATDTWRTLSPMTAPRHSTQAGVIDDVVYVAAGSLVIGRTFTDVHEGFSFKFE